MTIKGIFVPEDLDKPIDLVDIDGENASAIQSLIGGYFQCIDFMRPAASLFCDDEGKINDRPINRRASLLLWVHEPRFRFMDAICGDALILGQPDEDGRTQTVPDELVDLLFNTKSYRYLVQTASDGPNTWTGNQMTYEDWLTTYNDACALALRWTLVTDIKVVPS